MNLRPYQSECLAAIRETFVDSQSAIAIMATGLGKTVVFGSLAHDWPEGRVLILAHREELIEQAAEKVHRISGDRPDIEKAEREAYPLMWGGSKIVVASVQSLCQQKRLNKYVYDPKNFGLVVVDECHRASKKNVSYARVLNHFKKNPDCRVLGVTATADRTDKVGLGHFFEKLAYRFDLPDAIDNGWLSPVAQRFVVCRSLNFADLPVKKGGDFTDESIEKEMQKEQALLEVAAGLMDAENGSDRPTLVFAAGISHAELLADILNRHPGIKASAVHGGNSDHPQSTDERRRRIQAFRDGEYQYLVGCDVFYEGFDCPRISRVAIARPTKSRLRYAQAVGRGTRLDPTIETKLDPASAAIRRQVIAASGKRDCLVLDFVGLSSNLKLTLNCTTADLLAGSASAEAVRRARTKASVARGSSDMREAIREAEQEIKAQKEKADRRKWEWLKVKGSKVESVEVDPFGFDGPSVHGRRDLQSEKAAATPKQKSWLQSQGLWQAGMGKAEAGRVIGQAKARFAAGLATSKQAKLLKEFGESPSVYRDQATVILDIIARRGWRRRNYKLTRDRWRLRQTDGSWRAVVSDPDFGSIPVGPLHGDEQSCRNWIEKRLEQPDLATAA